MSANTEGDVKKFLIYIYIVACCFLFCSYVERSYAWPLITADGMVSRASVGNTDLGTTTGFGVGVNADWNDVLRETRVVTRADLSYFKWEKSAGYLSWSSTRVLLFTGIRIYMPLGLFFDTGLGWTYVEDRSQYTGPLYGIKSSGSSINHDGNGPEIIPGIGIELPFIGNTTIGALGRYYVGTRSGSAGMFIGYHF